ncbi:hypothetical protein A2U01_0071814, partial [Trifolium medium]|nr:hypothetical protein [Trifolium medium]
KRNGPVVNGTSKIQQGPHGNENSKLHPKGHTFKEVVQGGGKNLPRNNQKEWIAKAKGKGKSRLTEEEYRAGIMEIEVEGENLKQLEGSYVGTLKEFADV